MKITAIREQAIPVSRYAAPAPMPADLDTSAVVIETDVELGGERIRGLGFGSIGRFAQSGLIRERFAPRLLEAPSQALLNDAGDNLNPFNASDVMMRSEKPGGHGERCVAVGALDMALCDLAAKVAGVPLHVYLARALAWPEAAKSEPEGDIAVYGAGGYLYPGDDIERLKEEVAEISGLGFTRFKMKVGTLPVSLDLERIKAASEGIGGPRNLAVDAVYSYGPKTAMAAAEAFRQLGLWWLEDICDPHDFETQTRVAKLYPGPIAAGEALFSEQDARLLHRHGGLRRERDILLFDVAHCYGISGFLKILKTMERGGWPRAAFWPHGGHLFTQHVVAALGLGGAEVNPLCFQPLCGLADGQTVEGGRVVLPDIPGIGWEGKADAMALFDAVAKTPAIPSP